MGSGQWDASTYASTTLVARSKGTNFAYSNATRNEARDQWKAHPDLEPLDAGIRESRDSDEHPNSVAISVLFDVTGSMTTIPGELQGRLPDLFSMLLLGGFVEDPQVCMGAIGDATSDRVALQVGQFESDNRIDDNLANIFLEGHGGGQLRETYELGMYFMARHTALDCVEKRGHKGYLFMVGDESPYASVKASQVKSVIGDDIPGDIPTDQIVDEVREKFELFFFIPKNAYHGSDSNVVSTWNGLLGSNAINIGHSDHITDAIATIVGMGEGNVTLDEACDLLASQGKTEVADDLRACLANVSFTNQPTAVIDDPDGDTVRV